MIAQPLVPFLEALAFGQLQWAFRNKSSARDLIVLCTARWVMHVCRRNKIGVYLFEISGALDKVRRTLLLGSCLKLGFPNPFLIS